MLLQFILGNWMSFKNEVTYSAIAGRELQHKNRLPKINHYNMKVLPISAFYGGNASGKSNLINALYFAKRMVTKGVEAEKNIPIEPFILSEKTKNQPSIFSFLLLINEKIYRYNFSLNSKKIVSEKLSEIKPSKNEKLIYERNDKNEFNIPGADEFTKHVAKATRENKLFITNSVDQNLNDYKYIYDWFKKYMEVIMPSTHYAAIDRLFTETEPIYSELNKMLCLLDTGIIRLEGREISFESLPFTEETIKDLKERVQKDLTKDEQKIILETPEEPDRYLISKRGGKLHVTKIVTCHQNQEGKEERFELRQESEGTLRAIDLIPAFLDSSFKKTGKLYVIDELERSLHHLMTKSLVEKYLSSCNGNSRSQILFTTHDLLLMNQNLFRRDEMYLIEKDKFGSSEMFSLNEYKNIRYDKDIMKSYLQGRLGGIPNILVEDIQ